MEFNIMYIQVSFLKRNSKKLLPSDLSQLSRGLAYECSLPKVDNWHADQVRCYPNQQEALNPYIVTSLPGKSQLQEWRRAIDKQDTTQWKYMETSKGRLDIDCLNQLTRFHTVRNIQAAVEEEIQWFARPFNKPETVVQHPTASSISGFQNFLYCKRYDEISKPYGLSSDELSKLCTERWWTEVDTSALNRGGHKCNNNCAQHYPLQTCSSICGIVVMVVAAIAMCDFCSTWHHW